MAEVQEMHISAAPDPGEGIEECWMEIEGAHMRYLRAGSGPPLILLHGLLGYSFSWRFTMPALAPFATVYAPDLLGAGFSDRPPESDRSLQASARRIVKFTENLGLCYCDVLGASLGGALAMRTAALAPRRVRRLILVAPVNPWSTQGRWRARFLTNPLVAPLFLRIAPHFEATHNYFLRRLFGDPRRLQPGAIKGYSAPFAIPGTFQQILGTLQGWKQTLQELESVLPAITDVPALLLWGSADKAVSLSSSEYLRKLFKNSRMVVFEGVGHVPFEEVPDDFNQAVIDFLRS
jgi:pimeloyl-ACP methyl ester carboxylesterase